MVCRPSATLFVFRRRGDAQGDVVSSRAPGHPWTTAAFVLVSWLVVANTVYRYPSNALIGVAILVAGLPAYWLWRRDGVSRPSPAS